MRVLVDMQGAQTPFSKHRGVGRYTRELVKAMGEMLGENNEWGIVTENSEEALYQGIKELLDEPALLARYREQAAERGKMFSTKKTVRAVEEMLENL